MLEPRDYYKFNKNTPHLEIYLDVKAVTYNEMFVKKEKGGFVAQVVVDV